MRLHVYECHCVVCGVCVCLGIGKEGEMGLVHRPSDLTDQGSANQGGFYIIFYTYTFDTKYHKL